jgi:drug/metabolite transporter (DMT)-like permease
MSATAARIRFIDSIAGVGPLPPRLVWTLLGMLAIPLWATWPLLAVWTKAMPMFQFLTIIFAAGAITLTLLRPVMRSSRTAPVSDRTRVAGALMVTFGLFVSDILFLLAIRLIPAGEANLILYLWPLMVVLAGGLAGLLRLGSAQGAAVAIGLAGAALVIGQVPTGGAATGILLALGGGAAWATLVLFRIWQGPNAPDALLAGFWLSAAVGLLLHLTTETFVMPDAMTLFLSIAVGVVPLSLGNLIWDVGVRRGDGATLAVMAYATPLFGALFLILAGEAVFRWGLLAGGVLIVTAGILAAQRSNPA